MSSQSRLVDLTNNDLGRDAWGRPKVINDFSVFNALWTYNIPARVWLQYEGTGAGYTEQLAVDNDYIKSYDGALHVKSDSTKDVKLSSKRHPRYQANRGLLYSTAVILPNPKYIGKRAFGLFSDYNGLFFEFEGTKDDWKMYFVRRVQNGVVQDIKVDITERIKARLPEFDPSKDHVYDIQAEWRGVGNIYIYVDLTRIYVDELLGTLEAMSVSNTAMNVSYACYDAGDDSVEIIAGCVDVTVEGGGKQNKLYSSVTTGTPLLSTTNTGKAIIAIRLPEEIMYNGQAIKYTRDMVFTELSTFCKDEAFRTMYGARAIHVPNIDALTGWETNSDSYYEYKTNSDGALDTAFQLDKGNMIPFYTTRTEKDFSNSHNNPDPQHTDFYLTAGDIILLEMKSDGNSTGGCTLEFAEEV